MDEAVMGALSTWWQTVAMEHGAAEALAQLCVQLGQATERSSATFLADAALLLQPDSTAALGLLERRTPEAERRSLWTRYEAFLSHVPTPDLAADVRERLIALLFELGHSYSALLQVDLQLAALASDDLEDSAIEAAYQALLTEQLSIQAEPERVERLSLFVTPCEVPDLACAAE